MASMPQDKRSFTLLSDKHRRTSKRVVTSYILDWVCIIALAAVGAILYRITGSEHVFSLDDPSLSYPLKPDTVSIVTVGITCCAVPAILIAALSLLPLPPLEPWPLRLWNLHTGLLGLGLGLAGAFFVTSGLKDVVGKPRPDLLARCQPDLSQIAKYAVGGLGLERDSAPTLVSTGICKNPDPKVIRDGFAAFPSGHTSFAWAGLLYLSLWLGGKFGFFTSSLPLRASAERTGKGQTPSIAATAAPPLYLLILSAIPVGGALYICATRYMDYMHAGWDILGGSAVGIGFALLGFFWYHVPAGRGARRGSTAFGMGFAAEAAGGGGGGGQGSLGEGRRLGGGGGEDDVELGVLGGRGYGHGDAMDHDGERVLQIRNV